MGNPRTETYAFVNGPLQVLSNDGIHHRLFNGYFVIFKEMFSLKLVHTFYALHVYGDQVN